MAQTTSKGIWGRAKTAQESGGGVWQHVDSQLADKPPPAETPRLSIWEVLSQQPGGVWFQLGDETIVQDASISGVWSDALDETLILDRGVDNIWRDLGDETVILDDKSEVELWREIGDETIVLTKPKESLWEKADGTPGFIEMRPTRQLGYAIKHFETAGGESYYILKNLRQGSYLRLTDRHLFIWNYMDGENTIQDIAIAYMSEYGNLDIGFLVDFLKRLEVGNFLTTQTTNIYEQLRTNLSGQGILSHVKRIVGIFLKKEFPIRNIDKFYTRTYDGGVKYFYSKPALVLYLFISLFGMVAFVYLLATGKYSVITGATSSLSLGVISLYLTRTFALFIHEGGHAYTCKHYGREIRKSGVMIYYGMLAFYVDTTDIWLEKRFRRIMVSFGGPYTGFILGGAASLISVFSPWTYLNGWMYQLAFLVILDSIFNLNPLLKWDGYYILMDVLEIPNLRTRSLTFLKSGKLFKMIFQRKHFSREELIFSIYGFMTFLYTASIVISFLIFFGDKIILFISSIISPYLLLPILILLVLFLTRRKIMRIAFALTHRGAALSR
jgi:putative peptide zinc metalloprotease protein